MTMATRGIEFPNNPNDFIASMNPYQLVRLTDAFDRAGIYQSMMKVTCFVDTQPCKKNYQKIAEETSTTLVNFADRANVLKFYWDHCIKGFSGDHLEPCETKRVGREWDREGGETGRRDACELGGREAAAVGTEAQR
jgi:hypothetical protein